MENSATLWYYSSNIHFILLYRAIIETIWKFWVYNCWRFVAQNCQIYCSNTHKWCSGRAKRILPSYLSAQRETFKHFYTPIKLHVNVNSSTCYQISISSNHHCLMLSVSAWLTCCWTSVHYVIRQTGLHTLRDCAFILNLLLPPLHAFASTFPSLLLMTKILNGQHECSQQCRAAWCAQVLNHSSPLISPSELWIELDIDNGNVVITKLLCDRMQCHS